MLHPYFTHDFLSLLPSGMDELHLEIYVEDEARIQCRLHNGQASCQRETATQLAEFDHTHKEQMGGSI